MRSSLILLMILLSVEANWYCPWCRTATTQKPHGDEIYEEIVDDECWYTNTLYDDEIKARKFTVITLPNGTKVYSFLVVSDLDKDTKADGNWTWRAIKRKGNLIIDKNETNIRVIWIKGSDRNLTTHFNYKGRAMELSDLSEFNDEIISPDDKAGMLYVIKKNKAIPWVFLNSGPGNTTKAMKAEWSTVYGNHLIVGSHGTEYRNRKGEIVTEDPMWIKVISKTGEVRSCNWKYIYKRLRRAVNITAPGGYLTHEAIQWSEFQQKWFFLPRKESNTTYNEMEDETKGTNLLIIGNPNITDFEVVRVGSLSHPEFGFSAFDFVPGTNDTLVVALKSKEVSDENAESYITVFNISGHVFLDDSKLENEYKFEGICFE